jgi:hypothetical protein
MSSTYLQADPALLFHLAALTMLIVGWRERS